MPDSVSWAQLGILVSTIVAFFGFYRWINALMTEITKKVETVMDNEREERLALERQTAQFRESAFRTFVSGEQLKETEGRIIQAINKLNDRLDRAEARAK